MLRYDGFVSVNAQYETGEFLTKPLKFSGRHLEVNYSTSAAGGIHVEIQDAAGQPIKGVTLDDSKLLYGDEISRIVKWNDGTDISRLAGQPIRLRFVMNEADLYSIRFHD